MGGKNSYESIKRYQDKVYDRITLRVAKGERGEIQKIAESAGKSINAYILEAVRNRMKSEQAAPTVAGTPESDTSDSAARP